MTEINYPNQTTYFIAYLDQKNCSWGKVNPDECMAAPHPNLFQTTDENEWLTELENYYVVWGYEFTDIQMATFFKKVIEDIYGVDTVEINIAEYNNPVFWYILGYFPLVFGEIKQSFQVYPSP